MPTTWQMVLLTKVQSQFTPFSDPLGALRVLQFPPSLQGSTLKFQIFPNVLPICFNASTAKKI